MNKFKYAVVAFYTFDIDDVDTPIYLFNTREEAVEYLQKFWEHCFNMALEDENFNEEESWHSDDCAVLKWGNDENEMRVFQVTATSEPMKFGTK